jgi:transglutaminase-like putative cysteine protease
MKRYAVVSAVAAVLIAGTAFAKTLMLEGRLDSSINMRQQMEFSVDKGEVQTFTFRFALPADYQFKSVSQSVDSLSTRFDPQPSSSNVETDRFGNRFQKVVWNNLGKDIRVNLGYTANIRSELSAMESRTPFPIGKVAAGDAVYLKATELVQSDAPEISELARRLTAGAKSEYEAVTAITNHVADAVKYTFNPPKYDALYTLETKSGNCQNFAHINIALLRSVGIPARIVGGITLKDSWKVPIDARNSIVQSMGQGGHAWMEVYFPDLGWLPYDPQQSRQFTSSRHIKQTHGLDSRDINDTWRGAPYLPRYSELIEGSFKSDDINLKVKSSVNDPRPYIISNLVATKIAAVSGEAAQPLKPKVKPDVKLPVKPAEPKASVEPPAVPVVSDAGLAVDEDSAIKVKKPAKVIKSPVKPPTKPIVKPPLKPAEPKIEVAIPKIKKPAPGSAVAFGNMEFPNLVDGYSVQGDTGTRILDKETSEYVTSHYIYSQAFILKDGLALDKVSLAMRKFGGDGTVYIDLVQDQGGKPNILAGMRSDLVSLENISRKPGYYWVDFSFPHDAQSRLKPGKYWIVFRYSGEAIMNWYYIPGKPYSDSDDTRSTAKGFQWEDILNYDFVFKVSGKTI